ncbi:MAG: phosphatidate cytidylyltransferase [candidate division Zixibacteria bacterium]|nr:phosphatidate cytidylyltransferase [candidate division Zixibacteria bacterium]
MVSQTQELKGLKPSTKGETEFGYDREVWRKLLHLFALSIPIGYQFVSQTAAVLIVFVCFLGSLAVDLARFRGWPIQRLWNPMVSPIVRPKESHNFTGATFILLSGWLCRLIFSLPAATFGMLVIILGDTSAALIGRRWGRHRTIGNRTVEGSVAFLAAAVIAGVCTPGLPLAIGLALAVPATFVEMFSTRIDDNLSVPLVVGLCSHLALKILAQAGGTV